MRPFSDQRTSSGRPYDEQPTSRGGPQDQFTDHHLTISDVLSLVRSVLEIEIKKMTVEFRFKNIVLRHFKVFILPQHVSSRSTIILSTFFKTLFFMYGNLHRSGGE